MHKMSNQLDSKFGFDLTQIDSIIEHIINIDKSIKIRGLHAHIGSQIFETKVYDDEARIVLEEIKRIKEKYDIELKEINKLKFLLRLRKK